MSKKPTKTKKPTKAFGNREQWLTRAATQLQARVFSPAGVTLPTDFRVSCSWPGGGSARKRVGECWPRSASAAKVNEVFISPAIADPMFALNVLMHELVHVHDDCKNGHKGTFKRAARAVGLEGKLTSTTPSDALRAKFKQVVESIGGYPHATLSLADRKKQTTRMIKVECPECEGVFRTTQKWIDAAEMLRCPFCSSEDVRVEKQDARSRRLQEWRRWQRRLTGPTNPA